MMSVVCTRVRVLHSFFLFPLASSSDHGLESHMIVPIDQIGARIISIAEVTAKAMVTERRRVKQRSGSEERNERAEMEEAGERRECMRRVRETHRSVSMSNALGSFCGSTRSSASDAALGCSPDAVTLELAPLLDAALSPLFDSFVSSARFIVGRMCGVVMKSSASSSASSSRDLRCDTSTTPRKSDADRALLSHEGEEDRVRRLASQLQQANKSG